VATKGVGDALLGDKLVAEGEFTDSILGVACWGVDFTHDVSLFFCDGKEEIRLAFFGLMVLGRGADDARSGIGV
jgi:hypothetical protein